MRFARANGYEIAVKSGGHSMTGASAPTDAVVIDLRNIYKPEDMRARGFAYSSVGRA